MTVFKDVLFDVKKLIDSIDVAAWGQGFEDGSYGSGISLDRVIDCLKDALAKPAENESYVQRNSKSIFFSFARLTSDNNSLCKSGNDIREVLSRCYDVNTNNFSSGEKVLIRTLQDLPGDDLKFMFYLCFQGILDNLLEKMMIKPNRG